MAFEISRADGQTSSLTLQCFSTDPVIYVSPLPGHSQWTTNSVDYPFDILVGGERMTVTAITNGTFPEQVFTVTRSINNVVIGHPAGTLVYLFKPVYLALV